MHWTHWIRQTHRWVSVIFIITVIAATFAAVGGQDAESFFYYLPLPPLFLQMITGIYLFALPYAVRWRGARRTS